MNNDISQQLNEIKTSWDALSIAEDFSGWGMPGLTKQLVSDSIGGLTKMADELAHIENFEPDLVTNSFVQITLITNLRAYVTQHIPSNPQPHISGLLEQIERIRSTLWRWIEEANAKEEISAHLINQLSEAVSRMDDASRIFEILKDNKAAIESSASQSQDDAAKISSFKTDIESQHSETASLNSQIKAFHEEAQTNVQQISTQVSEFANLKSELNVNKQNQETLFQEFEANRDQVNRLLEDTNRATMAASFVTRKNELRIPIIIWSLVFGGSILALIFVAKLYIAPSIDTNDWYAVLKKLPLTAPLVWLGWFSAKQYGYTIRLREDYAYKVASAMAFEGYKREATETDPELKKKLLDTAISHLSDNPLRIFNGHENHASPVQEILERS